MIFFRKKEKKIEMKYDPSMRRPAIRSSICTGEKVAGFENLQTEKFEEIQLIRNDKDLQEFKKRYGIEGEIRTIY